MNSTMTADVLAADQTEKPSENQLLAAKYDDLQDVDLLKAVFQEDAFGEIATVSSFGADSALLLSMLAEVDASIPVIFLETGKHFPETLEYVAALSENLGLENLHYRRPDARQVKIHDTIGDLWESSVDACCDLRKVKPLEKALSGYDSWISGRKRFHGADRSGLQSVEWSEGRFKINPLAHWTADQIRAEFEVRELIQHPLVAEGFLSIGCAPCTRAVLPGEDTRAGRWAESDKTECGIHSDPWIGANI